MLFIADVDFTDRDSAATHLHVQSGPQIDLQRILEEVRTELENAISREPDTEKLSRNIIPPVIDAVSRALQKLFHVSNADSRASQDLLPQQTDFANSGGISTTPLSHLSSVFDPLNDTITLADLDLLQQRDEVILSDFEAQLDAAPQGVDASEKPEQTSTWDVSPTEAIRCDESQLMEYLLS